MPNHPDISFSPTSDGLEVSNPATGETLVFVRATHSDDLKLLVQKTEAAQRPWVAKTVLERAGVLWYWYFLIKESKEEPTRVITVEQGKDLNGVLGKIDYAASLVHRSAGEARRIDNDALTSMKISQKLVVLKQSAGVIAVIIPWNFPSAMIACKAAPALVVGRAMIVKPASLTPLSAYVLALLAYKADVLHDLSPVVSGCASEISHEFATNPTVRKISFTGSTRVSVEIFAGSAVDIKKFSLELGGNAPFIMSDDTDLGKTVEGAIVSKFRSSGQTCVCTNRVYAQSGIYDEFCRRSSEKVVMLKLGNGLDESASQGLLTKEKAVERVEQHIVDALSKSAACLTGDKRSTSGEMFFEPTALSGVTTQMVVAREETSGLLCLVSCLETEVEVTVATNDTEYGSAAYLFTSDTTRQWRVDEALEYGMVDVNTGLINNEAILFGGVERNELGREGGEYSTDEYLESKYSCIDMVG